ncbi:thioesterase-like superfamily-domain-containing protein [Mycena latifolia]|nr:thioesterase-like superfamily-domain-containing protein [Mycena latifolia]
MAPLTRAIRVKQRPEATHDNSFSSFTGEADPEWVIGRVPNGGYILSLIIQSCIQHQGGSALPDPLHVSAHFLQATKPTNFEVQVRVLKRGRNFINILADLVQGEHTRIAAHLIFGKIPPSTGPVIDPASGYARRHPLRDHPSTAAITQMSPVFGFHERVRWAEDPYLIAQNNASAHSSATRAGGLAVWGAWIELVGAEERITPAALAFLADCIHTFGTLVPPSVTGIDLRSLWLPSLALSLEYKASIPPPSALHAARTVGVYLISGFVSAPQGRHDTCVEIWTAPANIGEGAEVEGWRDAQVCLAVATQMQLMVSGTVNEAKGKL